MLKYLMLKVSLWMVKSLNKDIIDKVNEITKIIENSPDYKKYLEIRKEMQKNSSLMKLINEVKILQKDAVHHIDNNKVLKDKMDELNSYPLYREYNNALYEINNVYAIIENSLNNYFQEKFN